MRHYCSKKEINELVHSLVCDGGEFVPGKKHGKLRLKSGKTITLPRSPSDYRAILNIKSDLRRLGVAF
ncbi:hypothetical protein AU476_19240 [Cupriavidus sp. UYMSc13B]|nr:hypothetical protein AU476_19240 [Cupriavidus sp. UYMSc13B]